MADNYCKRRTPDQVPFVLWIDRPALAITLDDTRQGEGESFFHIDTLRNKLETMIEDNCHATQCLHEAGIISACREILDFINEVRE